MSRTFNAFTARRARGFSPIELWVAVGIIGILAAIAYPSYIYQMKKSRRSEAQQFLMDVAQRQQQYLLDQRAYATDLPTLSMTAPADVLTFYNVTAIVVTAGPPAGFTASLAPKAGTLQTGDVTLSIDNLGNKLPAGYW